MFEFCSTTPSLSSIEFFFIARSEVNQSRLSFYSRFMNVKTIPGTRSYHQFTPQNSTLIAARGISEQNNYNIIYDFMENRMTDSIQVLQISNFHIGDYISCIYDYDWYIGLVEEGCEEEGDVKISFMHPKGPGRPENCLFWPATKDICHIPVHDIIKKENGNSSTFI